MINNCKWSIVKINRFFVPFEHFGRLPSINLNKTKFYQAILCNFFPFFFSKFALSFFILKLLPYKVLINVKKKKKTRRYIETNTNIAKAKNSDNQAVKNKNGHLLKHSTGE